MHSGMMSDELVDVIDTDDLYGQASMDLAPEDQKAAMFGLYYLIRDAVVSLAAFGGAFLWLIHPHVNLLSAFGFGVIGTCFFAIRGRDLGTDST